MVGRFVYHAFFLLNLHARSRTIAGNSKTLCEKSLKSRRIQIAKDADANVSDTSHAPQHYCRFTPVLSFPVGVVSLVHAS